MTKSEEAAFAAGVQAVRQAAMAAAVTIECRDDARKVRQQAAAAALHGLAEGAKALLPSKPNPLVAVMGAIAADLATSGEVACPTCAGRLVWAKDSSNGHIHAQCEGACGRRVMQ